MTAEALERDQRAPFPPGPAGRGLVIAIALLTLAGALLRIAAARGPLWLDEIWSFRIVSGAPSLSTVFVGLPYDTNHVLTSAWLFLVGPQAPPILARAEAILFGTLAIPAAALIGARRGRAESIAAGALFALDYVFVHFGSEARGYAGLILAILLAYDALERFLETGRRDSLVVFALAVAFGTFSHLTMAEATAALCVTGLLRLRLARGPVLQPGLALLAAAGIGTAPALICVAASLTTGPLHTGLVTPFSLDAFGEGLGRMVRAEIGLYDGPLDPRAKLVILLGGAGLAGLAMMAIPPARRVFPAVTILALPVLHAALHLPNQQYPRFHLLAGVGIALLAAELWGKAWRGAGVTRVLAASAVLACLVGQIISLSAFLQAGRGDPAKAVAIMGRNGPADFVAEPAVQAGETAAVIRWYAERAHVALKPVASACASPPPDWLVVVSLPFWPHVEAPDETVSPCRARFARAAILPAYGFSGFRWTLYRREP